MKRKEIGYDREDEQEEEDDEIIEAASDEDENADEVDDDDDDDDAAAGGEEDVDSDEEYDRNTIGHVPIRWYDEEDHIGYDRSGKKLTKSAESQMSEVERFLKSKDDPLYKRTVYDPRNDETTVLTNRELVMIKRLLASKFPEPEFNAEPDYIDYYSSIKMVTPIMATPEPKRRFLPSKWERMKVMKIYRGIKEGRIKLDGEKEKPKKSAVYLMWGEDGELIQDKSHIKTEEDEDEDEAFEKQLPGYMKWNQPAQRVVGHIPAPKPEPPGHGESYHPPQEYLWSKQEIEQWIKKNPGKNPNQYIPSDMKKMRLIPAYSNFVQERFDRCLDLFLATRVQRDKLNINPESLVPKLPQPRDLRPFPNTEVLTYVGHRGRVRSIAVDPLGEYLASGGDDGTVRIWEIESGRCIRVWKLGKAVSDPDFLLKKKTEIDELDLSDVALDDPNNPSVVKLAWNPRFRNILAAAYANTIHVIYVGLAATASSTGDVEAAVRLLSGSEAEKTEDKKKNSNGEVGENDEEGEDKPKRKEFVKYVEEGDSKSVADLLQGGRARTKILVDQDHSNSIVDMVWHHKGEYLASVSRTTKTSSGQVSIHNLAKRKSQSPFSKAKAITKGNEVQRVLFHPTKPVFFVANKTHIFVYHLQKQALIKKLYTGVKWISSIALHPGGDHIVSTSFDRRIVWHDMDAGIKPYKSLKYHTKAVRSVSFHARYPLFATVGDDGYLNIIHARVFDDYLQLPTLVPVKRIRTHLIQKDGVGITCCEFHPNQPWIFTAGADGFVRLFQNTS